MRAETVTEKVDGASQTKDRTMTTNTKNPFFAPQSTDGDFEVLEPGSYNAVCIGVTVRDFPNYNDRNVMDEKIQYVFEICEGGQQYFLRSKPCKLVISEKSNLFLMINSWTKATLERMTEGFSCEKMVGFGAQIVVTQREYNGKTYADIANILPLKKGVKVPVTPCEIPAFLAKGVKAALWADGITVKKEAPNAAVTQPAQAPAMPAGANVTQNQNAAAFMGVDPTLRVTQPAPAQVPDVHPTASEAIAAEGLDDDSDLPF